MIIVFAIATIGIVTGLIVAANADRSDDGWAYEYEIKREPECFKRSKTRRRSCNGADCINDFVCNDCASCPFWRGKC